jgi:hypothetical protein
MLSTRCKPKRDTFLIAAFIWVHVALTAGRLCRQQLYALR